MSTDYEGRAVTVDEDSLAAWETGGSEYVVRLSGELEDRWVESYVLTRRRSPRFGRFHLNRARSRVSFLCRESDNPEELSTVVANLKLLVAQTNRRTFSHSWDPDPDTDAEGDSEGIDAAARPAPSEFGDETIATHVPRTRASDRATAPSAPSSTSISAFREGATLPLPAVSNDELPGTGDSEAPPEGRADKADEADKADKADEAPEPLETTQPARAPESSAHPPDSAGTVRAEEAKAVQPLLDQAASRGRVLDAITISLGRLEASTDARKARARLAQWMGTASLVIEDGGSEDELVAALFAAGDFVGRTPDDVLHDIGERFGERVLSLIKACDEAYGVLKPGGDPRMWSLFLRHTPPAARRIVCAARLRNARALLATYRRLDIARRLSFRDENRATLQDYRAVVEAFLEAGYSSHLVDVLDGVVLEMELAAGPASAERRQKRPLDRLTDELMQKVDLMED